MERAYPGTIVLTYEGKRSSGTAAMEKRSPMVVRGPGLRFCFGLLELFYVFIFYARVVIRCVLLRSSVAEFVAVW